jgi:hypothetical protein
MATLDKAFRIKNGLVVEGSTATVNGHDVLTKSIVDAKGDLLVGTADNAVQTLAVASTAGYVLTVDSSTTSGLVWSAPQAVGEFGSSIVFEGSSADDNETTLQVTNPTADRTITLPDATGTVALLDASQTLTNKTIALSSNSVSGSISDFNSALTDQDFATLAGTETLTNKTLTSPVVTGLSLNDASIVFEGATANDHETTLTVTDPTADRTITLPDATGTVALAGDVLALAGGTMSGAIAMGTNKITGLGTPTDSTDAATKGYVDTAVVGIDWKASVRAATTSDITLSSDLENGDVVDGVTLVTGDRVLVKNQSTGSQNGIYVVKASGAPDRSTDADSGTEVTANFAVFVEEGTVNADSGFTLTNNGAITIGTTALVFTQFTGLGQVTAGDGLTKTGNTLNVAAGTGISITGDAVTNEGVVSITGTADQVVASASTGAVTLSLPQSIGSTSTPTFSSVSVGSVTLTDALLSTATSSVATTSATVVDSWSASTYSSAKYLVQMKKGTEIQTLEVLINVDGGNNVAITEYADVINAAASLGTTDADFSGGNVRLLVTPAAADTVVKVHKTLIEA